MKKSFLIHPLLFVLYPTFHLYSQNLNEFSFHAILLPTIVLSLLTIFLFFSLGLLLKDYHKAAAGLSFFWLWFFSYDAFRTQIFQITDIIIFRHRYLMIVWSFVLIVMIIGFIKIRFNFRRITKYLNLAACILIVSTLMHMLNSRPISDRDSLETHKEDFPELHSLSNKNLLPNIYYIILDTYGGSKDLKELLGYDNREITAFLISKGFYVATNSRSNYAWTRPSMAASLNMKYLPSEADEKNPGHFKLNLNLNLVRMIENNEVLAFLRSIGYKYADLSIWNGLFLSSNYQTNYQYHYNVFSHGLLQMSILGKPVFDNYLMGRLKRKEIINQLEALETVSNIVSNINEPTFVYAHFGVPHGPFVFDQFGNEYPFFRQLMQTDERNLYVNQLIYTNTLLKRVIGAILEKSERPPIIIIQGDHGPRALCSNHEDNVRLRMSIFNAFYLPNKGATVLYDSITPVNTFRVIFNYYFGTNYELLEDRSYYQVRDYNNSKLILIN